MSANSEPVGMASHAVSTTLEGQRVGGGRFEIIAELGRGGMSEVYRAFDNERGEEVALKIIAARYVGRPERERRFANESQYSRRVAGQPHVVNVWDDGVLTDCGDRLFMTMELVTGPTLGMVLATRRRIPVQQAMEWARQIADGLRALHCAGIVHRDLTPANLLVEQGSEMVKIFDFGLAAEIDAPTTATASRLTLLGEAPGTHGYMAPEQAMLGAPAGAMDVYAFGAVLTEMLVGHNPFAHLDRSEYIEWQQTSLDEAPSIRRWRLPLAEELEDLIDDCLRRDPAERPRDGSDLVARLDALAVAPVVALAPGDQVQSVATDFVDEDADTIKGKAPPAEPRRPWVLFGLVALCLVLVGVAVGWWIASAVVDEPEPESGAVESPTSEGDEPPREASVVPVVESEDHGRNEPTRVPDVGPPETIVAPESMGHVEAEPERPQEATETKGGARRRPTRTKTRSAAKPASPPPCTDEAEVAGAFRDKRWTQVVKHTDSAQCWPDAPARARLRTKALFELGRYEECARLGAGAADVETRRLAKHCTMQLEEESAP